MSSPRFFADAAWGNDQLFLPAGWSDGTFPGDDDGFTNDFRLTLGVNASPNDTVKVQALHRMITERALRWQDEHARVDQLEIGATYSRTFFRTDLLRVSSSFLAGAAVLGPLGGMQIQQAWHSGPIVRGRTIGAGLQDTYEPRLSVTPLLGAGVGATLEPASFFSLTSTIDARVAPGQMASATANLGARLQSPVLPLRLQPFIEGNVSGTCQTTSDPRLTISGGYVPGCYASPAVEAGLKVGPVTGSFALRWNVGGAGHGMGETKLALEL